jgi:WhiB family redox-sensing transcriptional regulator
MVAAAEHWRSAAACQFADPDLFFPVSSSGLSLEQVAEAKQICVRCQVQRRSSRGAWRSRYGHARHTECGAA